MSALLAALGGFFGSFQPKDGLTLFLSAGALLVAFLAYRRGRTPKPHWRLAKATHINVTGHLAVVIVQDGPGEAEGVLVQVRSPEDSDWPRTFSALVPLKEGPGHAPRHLRKPLDLASPVQGLYPIGVYRVRVQWSEMPNTRKRHHKTLSVTYSGPTP